MWNENNFGFKIMWHKVKLTDSPNRVEGFECLVLKSLLVQTLCPRVFKDIGHTK